MTLDIIDNLCNWYIGKKKNDKKKKIHKLKKIIPNFERNPYLA